MRALAVAALAFSLLGWSSWAVICNVYEFAPRLPLLPLAVGWGLGLTVVWRTVRSAVAAAPWPRAAWALAALNVGWVAATHQGVEAAATPLFVGVALAVVGLSTAAWRRQARAAVPAR